MVCVWICETESELAVSLFYGQGILNVNCTSFFSHVSWEKYENHTFRCDSFYAIVQRLLAFGDAVQHLKTQLFVVTDRYSYMICKQDNTVLVIVM